jgi:hypothetical protein
MQSSQIRKKLIATGVIRPDPAPVVSRRNIAVRKADYKVQPTPAQRALAILNNAFSR